MVELLKFIPLFMVQYLNSIAGGFAFVYVAQDVTSGKDYALKVSDLFLC